MGALVINKLTYLTIKVYKQYTITLISSRYILSWKVKVVSQKMKLLNCRMIGRCDSLNSETVIVNKT